MWTTDDIKRTVEAHGLVIFGKGSKEAPMCGFTHRAIDVFQRLGRPFEVVNIFDDDSIRPALVSYTNWPTTPQCFVGGELIGGSDIAVEMFQNGELQKKVEAAFAARR